MALVSVDNTPVSVTLASAESVSVPTGETWKVTLEGGYDGNYGPGLNVNNTASHSGDWPGTETIFTAGDSLLMDTNTSGHIHIGGFKL